MNSVKLTITLLALILSFGTQAKEKQPTIIYQEIMINASIDEAWEILGPQFENAQVWASYEIIEGMPAMVKKGTNSWKLVSIDPNKAKLTIEMYMEIGGFLGTIMKPMMKMKMNTMGKELTEEFKFYVENGKPHSRKIKAMK